MKKLSLFCIILLPFFYTACKENAQKNTEALYQEENGISYYTGTKTGSVSYRISDDPMTLVINANRTNIIADIFSMIHGYVYNSELDGRMMPFLAEKEMAFSEDALSMSFTLRPEAKWEDGSPITAKDVLFSMKVGFCPLTSTSGAGDYAEYFKDFRFDLSNPKKFHIDMKSYYMHNHNFIANYPIIDQRVYDPQNILAAYTLQDFMDKNKQWEKDEKIKAFSQLFNDPKFGRDPKFVNGCGLYKLADWKDGKSITLVKKQNFWGKGIQGRDFAQAPDSIHFLIIKEDTGIEAALQSQSLDVCLNPNTTIFKKLKEDPKINEHYVFTTPERPYITYIALNQKPDGIKHQAFFQDLKVRKAIAYLVDIPALIQEFSEGFATQNASPVPVFFPQYNQKLKLIRFNLNLADSLLTAAGWIDTDGDNIREKQIKGKKVKFECKVNIPESPVIEGIALKVVASFQKAGIKATVEKLALKDHSQHWASSDFDMMFMANSVGSAPTDLKPSWHSKGEQNHSHFQDANFDHACEQMRISANASLFKEWADSAQKILYDQQAAIFFNTGKGKIIVHRRFYNAKELEVALPKLNTLEIKRKK